VEAGNRVVGSEKDEPLFMISVVAEMLNVHPQTLRLYEREGLISPSRSDGKRRLYSESDVEQLRFILHLTRDLGVNLAGAGMIVDMRRSLREMQRSIEELTGFIQTFLAEEFDLWKGKRRESLVRVGSSKVVRQSAGKP